jgi:hypothetical protein
LLSVALLAGSLAACSEPEPAPMPGGTDAAAAAAAANPAPPEPAAAATAGTGTAVPTPAIVLSAWDGVEPVEPGFEHCSLDKIDGVTGAAGEFVAAASEPLLLEGWIAAPGLVDPGTLTVYFKGAAQLKGELRTGEPRDDVAVALQQTGLAHAGFKSAVPAGALATGDYTIVLSVQAQGATHACAHHYRVRLI